MIKRITVEFDTETREFTINGGELMDWENIGLLETAKAVLIRKLGLEDRDASTDTSS